MSTASEQFIRLHCCSGVFVEKYKWEYQKTHGLERLLCVQLVLSAQPQKPHFDTLVGWTSSNSHLEAYLKAAPLLEIQLGLVKETWSRKTSLCATSSVSPAPKAPLFHNSGLTMFDSYFEARLQAAPLLLEILGACKQTWYRKVGMGPSGVISPAPKAPVLQKSGFGNVDFDLEASMQPQ